MCKQMARLSPQTARVVTLIDLLASRPGESLSLSEISRRLGVNKATCHAMLASLTGAGWLLRHPVRKTYRLGPALVAAGQVASEGFPALEFAHPAMLDLCGAFGLSCLAVAPADDQLTVVDAVGAPGRPVTSSSLRVGQPIPARPPFGAVFVVWASAPGALTRWLGPSAADEWYPAALEGTRRQGFVIELQTPVEHRLREVVAGLRRVDAGPRVHQLIEQLVAELPEQSEFLLSSVVSDDRYEVSAVNAPVFDSSSVAVLALSVFGFDAPLSGAEVMAIGKRVRQACDEVTLAIGGRAPSQPVLR
jgi:DNA-binding IclR family transcriptional regulator